MYKERGNATMIQKQGKIDMYVVSSMQCQWHECCLLDVCSHTHATTTRLIEHNWPGA
jgi:hypothetical protein